MQINGDQIQLSATDLANHLSCAHLTELSRLLAEGKLEKPYRTDPILEVLIERGNAHEKAYVESLRVEGKSVIEIEEFGGEKSVGATLAAMHDGADIIVQAALGDGIWSGRPDLLVRVEAPSDLGEWSYEVADTKLTRNTKAGTVLQLCLYSELLKTIQGTTPKFMSVVMPGEPFTIERLRYNDFAEYYRLVKMRLQNRVESGPNDDTYPEPVSHCDICRWWNRCNEQRRADDHLTFVAGISKSQIAELRQQGIETLTAFAERDTPLPERPKRGSIETFEKTHQQAKIQVKGQVSGNPEYEFIEVEPKRGFLRLPEPDPGDIYFDIEGDPHAVGGGLEYLLGYVVLNGEANEYRCEWALNRNAEKRSFEAFIDFVMESWRRHPGMHVYHYAPYEPAAMKRLATRHATRERELDQLLRAERFVDLYAVVRQGIRASVESYSIKRLEMFYGYERLEELAGVRHSLHRLERALELGINDAISEGDRRVVQVYNEDDCLSTLALHQWLEKLRSELIGIGQEVPRPEAKDGSSSEEAEEVNAQIAELFTRLTQGIEEERTNRDDSARWLMAHLLEYFRREDKCTWWEFFRMHDLEHEELLRERTALSGLTFEKEVPGPPRARNPTHRYIFEPQEVAILPGAELHEVMGEQVGSVADIDYVAGHLDIRKRGDSIDVHPMAVFAHERYNPAPMPESLFTFAESVAKANESGVKLENARHDLLSKSAPRLNTLTLPLGPLVKDPAVTLARDLNNSVLPIQGPPGTGKTHVGGEMIAELAADGKRIGVTAISHKVISNLLSRVSARSSGVIQIAHRTSMEDLPSGCERLKKTPDVLPAINDGKVVGGTAWVWSRPDIEGELDYLFVDEAGQMSLAMVLAAGRAAKNIVLLGDPQQLEQPQRGTHPEGAEVAALKHMLDGKHTIAADRGLFLDYTWRLHPTISRFTSEQFYDGRLVSRYGLERQAITGSSAYVGSGLFYAPVEHSGNQSQSDEEVTAVVSVCQQLLDGTHAWKDEDGESRPLDESSILVVAPYNAQVAALRRHLRDGILVGTVDKFQGQEAPIVIYSLTSSSAEDAPRGMEFLYSPNRLNVATSRARCLVVAVGNPKLFTPNCSSVAQMTWANPFCRYIATASIEEC